MADIPVIKSRNIAAVMGRVLDTHQRIKEGIAEVASREAQLRAARNEKMNADGKLSHDSAIRSS